MIKNNHIFRILGLLVLTTFVGLNSTPAECGQTWYSLLPGNPTGTVVKIKNVVFFLLASGALLYSFGNIYALHVINQEVTSIGETKKPIQFTSGIVKFFLNVDKMALSTYTSVAIIVSAFLLYAFLFNFGLSIIACCRGIITPGNPASNSDWVKFSINSSSF